RALRHTDAYRKGLSGPQAAYASKKYCGHQVLPAEILKECEDAGVLGYSDPVSVVAEVGVGGGSCES
ncbi:hypothetical protein BJ165DRAFT_1562954, partial [Panaeolus papilionaceus]